MLASTTKVTSLTVLGQRFVACKSMATSSSLPGMPNDEGCAEAVTLVPVISKHSDGSETMHSWVGPTTCAGEDEEDAVLSPRLLSLARFALSSCRLFASIRLRRCLARRSVSALTIKDRKTSTFSLFDKRGFFPLLLLDSFCSDEVCPSYFPC